MQAAEHYLVADHAADLHRMGTVVREAAAPLALHPWLPADTPLLLGALESNYIYIYMYVFMYTNSTN